MKAVALRGTGAVAVFAATAWLVVVVMAFFSADVHVEAPYVRATFNDSCGVGKPFEMFYSPRMGTLLMKTSLGPGRAAGWVFRVTTSAWDGMVLPMGAPYETTAFAAGEDYWCRVIWRDGYIPFTRVLLTAGLCDVMLTGVVLLCRRLRKHGLDEVADYLEGYNR